MPLAPETTVVARLQAAIAAWPQAKRFIVHDDWHPPMDELLKATAEYPVAVYARPQTDTCKEVVDGLVRRTIPRDRLVIARGPWVFDRQALAGALSEVIGREPGIANLLQLCDFARLRVRVALRP